LSLLPAQTLFSDQVNLSDPDQMHVIHTRRGDVLMGKILAIDSTTLTFSLRENAGTLSYAFHELSFVGILGERPNLLLVEGGKTLGRNAPLAFSPEERVQSLFYSATAFGYRETKGEYRNAMLAYNYADFGIGENFSAGAGLLIPLAFNLRLKTNFSIGQYVHLGMANNTFFFAADTDTGTWSHTYGVVTIGERRLFLNLTYGWGNNLTYSETSQIISIGGSSLLSERFRIMAEVFIVNDEFGDVYALPSITADYFGRKNKIQFGLTGIPDSLLPFFPLLAFSQYF
jgi:hypothetical protein